MEKVLQFLGHEYSVSGLAGALIMIGFILLLISSIMHVSKVMKKAGVDGFALFNYNEMQNDAQRVKSIDTKAKEFRLGKWGMAIGYSFIVIGILTLFFGVNFLQLPK